MSNTSRQDDGLDKAAWAIVFFLFTALGVAVFGWWGDRPSNVHDDESKVATTAQWLSTIFHVGCAAVASLYLPLVGLAWALFAAILLARRVCASGREALPLHMSEVPRVARCAPCGLVPWTLVLTTVAAVSMLIFELPYPLDGPQQGVARFGPWLIMVAMGFGAIDYKRGILEYRRNRDAWVPVLAKILGTPKAEMIEEGDIVLGDGGKVTLRPVPVTAQINFTAANMAVLDQRLAQAAGHLMFDPDSDTECIVLVPADEATRQRRAALALSDGLFGAEVGVPTKDAFASDPLAEDPFGSHSLILDESDFGGGDFVPLTFSAEDFR